MTTLQTTYILHANATSMNTEKNQQFLFEFKKTTRSSKHNKNLLLLKMKLQARHILKYIREFYITPFKDKAKLFDLTKKDLYNPLKSMQNDNSPDNDRLGKEFYELFLE